MNRGFIRSLTVWGGRRRGSQLSLRELSGRLKRNELGRLLSNLEYGLLELKRGSKGGLRSENKIYNLWSNPRNCSLASRGRPGLRPRIWYYPDLKIPTLLFSRFPAKCLYCRDNKTFSPSILQYFQPRCSLRLNATRITDDYNSANTPVAE